MLYRRLLHRNCNFEYELVGRWKLTFGGKRVVVWLFMNKSRKFQRVNDKDEEVLAKRKKSYHPAKTIIRLWYHFWCRHFRSSSQLGNPLFTRLPAQSFHCCDQTPAYATEKTTASTNIHMAVQVLQSLFRFAPNNSFWTQTARGLEMVGSNMIRHNLMKVS